MPQDSVKSLMSSKVISVLAETPIMIAMDILLSNNYNGISVTDKNGVIVGILTKYDLIIKRDSIKEDTRVKDVMNLDPLILTEDDTVDDAIRAFSEHHKVDPIPVVNSDRKVIGIISRYDMVKLFRDYGVLPVSGNKDTPEPARRGMGLVWIILLTVLGLVGLFYFLDIPLSFIFG